MARLLSLPKLLQNKSKVAGQARQGYSFEPRGQIDRVPTRAVRADMAETQNMIEHKMQRHNHGKTKYRGNVNHTLLCCKLRVNATYGMPGQQWVLIIRLTLNQTLTAGAAVDTRNCKRSLAPSQTRLKKLATNEKNRNRA
jgi:hypothetical protein